MHSDATPWLFVVVALVDPLEVGSSFNRTKWPAHVTLASNFLVNETDEVASAVGEACANQGPLPVRFGASAVFGRDRNVAVQIVESAEMLALHEQIADLLEALDGFAATEPAYWRSGYRPHMTRVATPTFRQGEVAHLPFVAVAKMTYGRATIASIRALASAPDG
ncbi:2'-5' RNA ligase family protein (plasmid) [Coraliomargarita sp. W4R53]